MSRLGTFIEHCFAEPDNVETCATFRTFGGVVFVDSDIADAVEASEDDGGVDHEGRILMADRDSVVDLRRCV